MDRNKIVDLLESNKVDSVQWTDPDRHGVSHTLQVCGNTNFIITFSIDTMDAIMIGDIEIYPNKLIVSNGNLRCYANGVVIASLPLTEYENKS